MGNSFEKSEAFNSSYKALMNIKERRSKEATPEAYSVSFSQLW
jgi:hypothetical protein